MNRNPSVSIGLRRIKKDLDEIQKEPIEGIGIAPVGCDIYNYVVNIKLLSGVYKGILLQLQLTIPQTYPNDPPKMLVYPNQPFDTTYHHHIFHGKDGYKTFCIDLLENSFLDTSTAKTGWTAAYTIKTVLIQIQQFLSDPDFSPSHKIPQKSVDLLFANLKKYSRSFLDENGKERIHTWENPYPPIDETRNLKGDHLSNKLSKIHLKDSDAIPERELREHLTCFFTKSNFIQEKSIILGYPIILIKGFKDTYDPNPIPEMLTYEGFTSQIQKHPLKLDLYNDLKFKSSMGDHYSHWFPVYINENHFQKNKTTILNAFTVLKYGPSGEKKYDFTPSIIFQVLPSILNKMIIYLFKNQSTISESAIRSYCHFILLFHKLINIYKNEFNFYLKTLIRKIKISNYIIDKKLIPDIGNILVLLYFSKSDDIVDKECLHAIQEETVIRQLYWVFHAPEKKEENMKAILEILKNDENLKSEFYKIKGIDVSDGQEDDVIEKDLLFQKLTVESNGKIENIFKKDKNLLEYFKNEERKKIIENNLKNPFNQFFEYNFNIHKFEIFIRFGFFTNKVKWYELCEQENKNLIKDLINRDEYVISKKNLNKMLNPDITPSHQMRFYTWLTHKYDSERLELFDRCTSNTKQQLLKYIFATQLGNKLQLMTHLASINFINDNFIQRLENNYGVLSQKDLNNFLQLVNEKKNTINTYYSLFNELGFGELFESEEKAFDRFMFCYIKASYKKYCSIRISNVLVKKYEMMFKNNSITQLVKADNLNNNNLNSKSTISQIKPVQTYTRINLGNLGGATKLRDIFK